MRFTRRWLYVFPVVVVGLMCGERLINGFAPPPCPQRAVAPPEDFPPRPWLARAGQVSALPAFARKENMTCSVCHIAQPYLNATGRLYKESGYRFARTTAESEARPGEKKIQPQLILEERFPWALGVEGTPWMMSSAADEPVFRPFQNLSLYSAGTLGPNSSYFVQFKLADEGGGTFEVDPIGYVGWYGSPKANLVVGHGGMFRLDPYNTLAGHTLTGGHEHSPSGKFITFFGRASKFYYSAGFNTGGDGIPANAATMSARVAYDLTPSLSLGLFGQGGRMGDEAGHDDMSSDDSSADDHAKIRMDNEGHDEGDEMSGTFRRAGLDANYSAGGMNALLKVEMRQSQGDEETRTDLAADVQLFYTLSHGGRPHFMPLVEFKYARDEGEEPTLLGVVNLSSYVINNVRIGLEGSYDLLVHEDAEPGYTAMAFTQLYW